MLFVPGPTPGPWWGISKVDFQQICQLLAIISTKTGSRQVFSLAPGSMTETPSPQPKPSTINHKQSTINNQQSTINNQQTRIKNQQATINKQP